MALSMLITSPARLRMEYLALIYWQSPS